MKHATMYRRITPHQAGPRGEISWREVTTVYADGRFESRHVFEDGDAVHVFSGFDATLAEMGWKSLGAFLRARRGFRPVGV